MTVKRFFGWVLVVIGVLVALTTGGCGLFIVIATTLQPSGDGWDEAMFRAALFFGFVPCLIGIGIAFWGRHLLRTAPMR